MEMLEDFLWAVKMMFGVVLIAIMGFTFLIIGLLLTLRFIEWTGLA